MNLCGRELQVWLHAAQRHFLKTVRTTSQRSGGHFSISEPRRRLKKDYRLSPGCAMTWLRGEEVNQTAMLVLEISGTHLVSQKPLATIRAAEKSDCTAAQILNVPQSLQTPRRLNISLRMHVAGSADLWESISINMVCYSSKCMQQTSFKKGQTAPERRDAVQLAAQLEQHATCSRVFFFGVFLPSFCHSLSAKALQSLGESNLGLLWNGRVTLQKYGGRKFWQP